MKALELRDPRTGDLVGRYPEGEETLRALAGVLSERGSDFVVGLVLVYVRPDGSTATISTSDDLLWLARTPGYGHEN